MSETVQHEILHHSESSPHVQSIFRSQREDGDEICRIECPNQPVDTGCIRFILLFDFRPFPGRQ
jgi:hypothetical protein